MADFAPSATIIADSISQHGYRLITAEVRLHRYMLPEFNTHRQFSRNSASSRAVPVRKVMQRLLDEPVYPLEWLAEQPGMQPGAALSADAALKARLWWDNARRSAVTAAQQLTALGVHKSIANRLLEPFMSHTVVVSATSYVNFFNQRCNPGAQVEIRAAAEALKAAVADSKPTPVNFGDWHLPFITDEDRATLTPHQQRQVSCARCARTSYLNHHGVRSTEDDLKLFHRLIEARPPHASPLEHVATPISPAAKTRVGNFEGWRQYRHVVLDG